MSTHPSIDRKPLGLLWTAVRTLRCRGERYWPAFFAGWLKGMERRLSEGQETSKSLPPFAPDILVAELRRIGLASVSWMLNRSSRIEPLKLEQLPHWLEQSRPASSQAVKRYLGQRLFPQGDVTQPVAHSLLFRVVRGLDGVPGCAPTWNGPVFPREVWRVMGELAWGDPDFRFRIARLLQEDLRGRVIFSVGQPPLPLVSPAALWWSVGLTTHCPVPEFQGSAGVSPDEWRALAFMTAGSARGLPFWDQWLIAEAALAACGAGQLREQGLPPGKLWPGLCSAPRYAGLPSTCRESGAGIAQETHISGAYAPLHALLETPPA